MNQSIKDPSSTFKPSYLRIMGFFYFGQGYSLGSLVLLLPLYMIEELGVTTEGESATIAAIILIPWYFIQSRKKN